MRRSLLLALAVAWPLASQEILKIDLDGAIRLALANNTVLKISQHKIQASEARYKELRSSYFPQLTNQSNSWWVVERQRVDIPQGALGVFPGVIVPPVPVVLEQGGNELLFTTTTLGQPVTQLVKIREGTRAAQAETGEAKADLSKARNEIAWGVQRIYLALLVTSRRTAALQAQVSAAEEKLRESESAVAAGNVLSVAVLGSRSQLLSDRQSLLAMQDQHADLMLDLDDLLGVPLDTRLELAAPPALDPAILDLAQVQQTALRQNPEIQAAQQTVEKARHGLSAARAEFIPELSLFGTHIYQNGVPFLSRNNGIIGFKLDWNIFDSGKRRQVVTERDEQLAQAELNLERLRTRTSIEVEKSFRKVARARQMVEVAHEALALRREAFRLSSDQFEMGVVTQAGHRESQADLDKAEADALEAECGYRLAMADLNRAIGIAAQ
jgi:outer membrane protein TolC